MSIINLITIKDKVKNCSASYFHNFYSSNRYNFEANNIYRQKLIYCYRKKDVCIKGAAIKFLELDQKRELIIDDFLEYQMRQTEYE